MNRAKSHRKGREISDAIDEAERENKAGIVPFEPMQSRFDTVPPFRESVEQPQPKRPAYPEIGLIAREAAQPGGCKQERRVKQSLCGSEGSKQHKGFPFEEGPHERNQIKEGAVLSDQLTDVHSRSRPCEKARHRGK